jgi:hypothetical protein
MMERENMSKIKITAKFEDTPQTIGWIAWITGDEYGPHYLGNTHASYCEAIETATRVIMSQNPGARISSYDPTPAQRRKAELAEYQFYKYALAMQSQKEREHA